MNRDTHYYLYPRLPHPIALQIAEQLLARRLDKVEAVWDTRHADAVYGPTGGNRIPPQVLAQIRQSILMVAQETGYPVPPDRSQARKFDVDCAVLLHSSMKLHPSEASHNDIWSFLGCVLLPDVVLWRFSDSNDTMRFVGRERGMRRHAFGRLWWRAYLAHNPRWKEPYILLRLMNEDDLVQVTERSSIAERPTLFRAFCASFVRATSGNKSLSRRDLIRETSKRMYRLLSLIAVEVLNEKELQNLTDEVFSDTVKTLSSVKSTSPR